jgi:uncharacterized protein YidB (DUF937 family)
MSGLDDLLKGQGGLGGVLGGLLGGGSGGGGGGALQALLPAVTGMLAGGGLGRVMSGLQSGGLKEQADSWVGTGANELVTGPQIQQALGDDQIAQIASRLGVSKEDAAAAVAEVLPVVVDKVTPEGTLPPDDEVDGALDALVRSAGDT